VSASLPNNPPDLARPVQPATRGPIFIIGSPRSGTSILTWCLGQHPNLLPLEESNWMAPFALDATIAFRRGTRRGERSQLASMGVSLGAFLENFGASVNQLILGHCETFEAQRIQAAVNDSSAIHPAFKIRRDHDQPKSRWVNGTPEYSFDVCGLRKLFPTAKFIHLVRECDQVVTSMLNFDQLAGFKLAATEKEGYQTWMQYVRACLTAEEAYGPEVVCRIFHHQLVQEPEKTIRRALEFVDEPFASACLEPLDERINSSKTQEIMAANSLPDFPEFAEAHELWKEVTTTPPLTSASPAGAALLEEQFEKRVSYLENLGAEVRQARKALIELQKEFKGRTEWAQKLNQQVEEKGRQLLDLQAEFSERTAWALDLRDQVGHKDEMITKLQAELGREEDLIRELQSKLSAAKTNS
jgi:hypothetical protein